MSTLQVYGQLFRPAKETGVKKAESMASHLQTPIQHSPELAMNHGNFLCGSDGANFCRLTQHLVFAFLGGYVSMDDLPCLGDLANGIDGFHRTTSISMNSNSESSQLESLDLNGNLHQLSAISMDLDFKLRIMEDLRKSVKTSECYQDPYENISIVLDSLDAFSPAEHSSLSTDEIELLPENSINAHLICSNSAIDILNLDRPTPSMPFQQCDFTGKFVLSTIDNGSHFDSLDSNNGPDILFENVAFKQQKINVNQTTEIQEVARTNHHHDRNSGNFKSQFHCHHKNLKDIPVSNICSTTAWNNEPINDGNTFAIPEPGTLMDYLYEDLEIPQFLDTETSSMQLEDLCCIIGNNGEGPTFSVPDPSQLMNFLYENLESPVFLSSESIEEEVPIYAEYDGNYSKVELILQSADHTIGESHQCSAMQSLAVPETTVGLMTESLCDSNVFTNGMDFNRVRIPSNSQSAEKTCEISDSKLSYHQDDFNVVDHKPKKQFPKNPTNFVPTIGSLLYKRKDDEENMRTDSSPFTSNTDEPSLMDKNSYENPEIYVSSPCCKQKICLLGDYDSDDDSEVAVLSDCTLNAFCGNLRACNTLSLPIKTNNCSLAGAFEENEITPTLSISVECNGEQISSDLSFFDLIEHESLLEMYGLSNQDQYTDIGCSCESPTWPGKPDGHLQKSQNYLTSNLTKDDTANGVLTTDPSLFHSNTDETSVMNKNWTDEIYEKNSENSVPPLYLNQMEPAFDTLRDDAGQMDCLPLLHSCSDGFDDSIENQSLIKDGNELKFAFPDPSTLMDHFFGSLDSPKFLASDLLDGKIDNLHYPSLFGDYEQGDRTEKADLSDKILDQCSEVGSSKNDSSINKFSCSIQLLDLISSPFHISDHDELLEWYGINDQDQFMDGNWTCDSPTWPGKI